MGRQRSNLPPWIKSPRALAAARGSRLNLPATNSNHRCGSTKRTEACGGMPVRALWCLSWQRAASEQALPRSPALTLCRAGSAGSRASAASAKGASGSVSTLASTSRRPCQRPQRQPRAAQHQVRSHSARTRTALRPSGVPTRLGHDAGRAATDHAQRRPRLAAYTPPRYASLYKRPLARYSGWSAFGESSCRAADHAPTRCAQRVLEEEAPPRKQDVSVFFLRGEQLAAVHRPGATAADALHQLLVGPTPAERAAGFRSYLPARTQVLGVTINHGLATVDMSTNFVSSPVPSNLLAGLAQVVRTVTGIEGTKAVKILVSGESSDGMFPGIPTAEPITFRYLQRRSAPMPAPRVEKLPPPGAHVRAAQRRLIALGYLLKGDDDGRLGPTTQEALLAFQKWERLDRTGLLDTKTVSHLETASTPAPLPAAPRAGEQRSCSTGRSPYSYRTTG
jgi:Sporulation and spore germination/Putative peptidoglycan binding domain